MQILKRPSPNYDTRPSHVLMPDMIIMHYTGMRSAEEALDRLCDETPPNGFGRVSAHYTITQEGEVYCHVEPEKRAWHAGVSYWNGREGLNDYSIGIELVNPGHEFGYERFPDEQIKSLVTLTRGLVKHFMIPKENVLGHQDIAPTRKQDPGELFPWDALAWEGLCLWPDIKKRSTATTRVMDESEIRLRLGRFGYDVREGIDTKVLIRAFNAHFCASSSDVLDDDGRGRLLLLTPSV